MDRVDRGIFGGASKEFQQSSSAVSNPPSRLQLLLLEPETNFQKLSSEMIFNFLRQIGGIYLVQTLTAAAWTGQRRQRREVHFRFGFDFATFW